MRTVTTDYGHLAEPVKYQIGIRKRIARDGTTRFYGHVHFPTKGTHKRTRMSTNEEGVKTFVTQCIAHSKIRDFAFRDQDGEVQWTDFDPSSPTADF